MKKATTKPDTAINPDDIAPEILRYREREKQLVPLRISPTTTILVPKAKCTREYAKKYYTEKLKHL